MLKPYKFDGFSTDFYYKFIKKTSVLAEVFF